MHLVTLAVIALAVSFVDLSTADEQKNSFGNLDVPGAAVKLDKNLRRALLKALTDLEAESAEQRKDDGQPVAQAYKAEKLKDTLKKDLNEKIGINKESSFSFKGFPGDEDTPSEDKLQNSSFVPSASSSMTIEKATNDDARSFHVQNIIMSNKSLKTNIGPKIEQFETKKSNVESRSSYVNKVESITLQPETQLSEGLTGVASNGIGVAQTLPAPKPTASSPTEAPRSNETSVDKNKVIEKSEEVKIFQAPLVAAFTVQQDESGVPKSVVPIFRPTGDGQALTLQEQLDFKQKLLEKQLEELQSQQIQQTQFLIRQRQLYEQQLRQKQQQQYYLQEQARIKQIEEQVRLKQLEEQRLKQLEEQVRLKQLEEQRLKHLDESRIYRFQQQVPLTQQKHRFFEQATNLLSFPTPMESNVRLQPSVSLEVPNVVVPPPFQPNYQEQLRLQQFRYQHQQQQQQQQQQQHQQHQQHQQQQQQHQQQHQQHQQQQQQRLQQSFGPIPDFQPPLASSARFNRQEAFNSVGNFGFNDKQTSNRNTFAFGGPPRTPLNNPVYNPYVQYRQTRPQQTPAKQIQNLLYQSGIAGDLGNAHGSGGQEDLNIVSKVLALNVGHIPNQNLHYTTNLRGGNMVGRINA